jgi:HEAT repeat protein
MVMPYPSDPENRLIIALKGNLSRDAQDYVCRKLAIVGTVASVSIVAGLLAHKDHSHMARFALERISAPEAAHALRDALDQVSGKLKIGVISSLGALRDVEAVAPLGKFLRDNDPAVARAAALSLGAIGNAESASVLQATLLAATGNQQAVIDALLTCADALLASNNAADAMSIFKSLSGGEHGRLVRLAATRGMLACAGKSNERLTDSPHIPLGRRHTLRHRLVRLLGLILLLSTATLHAADARR